MRQKIKISTIIYGFFLLLYYRPASYIIGNALDNLCLAAICAMSAYFFIKAILTYRVNKYHPTGTTIGLIAFFGWCMIGSTAVNYFISGNISLVNAVTTFLCEVGIIIVSDMELARNPKRYLKLFICIGGSFSLLNALTMFVYGNRGGLNPVIERDGRSLSSNYFYLGEDNATFFLVWPVLVLTWIYYFRYQRTKQMLLWSVFFTAMILASYLYMWSVTNIIGCILTIGLILVYWRRSVKKKQPKPSRFPISKFNLGWGAAIIANYLVVIMQIFLRYSDFIVNVLQKSITLGGRTRIWERSLLAIMQQPLIGFGYETRSVTLTKIIFNHTHNIMLEILYRGGLIGMILFIIVLLSLGRKVKHYQSNGIVMILAWCIVLFIFLSVFEFAFYRYPYIVLFVLLGRCNVLVATRKRQEVCVK